MPLSFPSSPSVNDQHTTGGRTYQWTGEAWQLVGSGIPGATGATGATGAAGSGIALKGSVAAVENLPGSGNVAGDSYVVTANGNLYVWSGSTWQNVGQIVGPTGAQGSTGPQGQVGAASTVTGPTGPAGAAGQAGAASTVTGPTGPASTVTGPTGPTGGGGSFTWASVPATTNATGTAGSLSYDTAYLYVATATNTWKRVLLSTFNVDDYWSSVVLLLHMDGTNNSTTFTDSSSSAKTVTASGDAKISTARSQWGGASGLFDGTGDYLSSASNAAWAFGTGDFVVECWVYRTSAPSLASILGVGYTIGGFGLAIDSSHQVCVTRPGTAIDHTFAASVPMDAWSHIAVARSGSSLRCYVDGVQKGSTANNSTNYAQGELVIGMDSDKANQGFIGNIDDLRITKGSARGYTGSTITVPTAAFPDS